MEPLQNQGRRALGQEATGHKFQPGRGELVYGHRALQTPGWQYGVPGPFPWPTCRAVLP
jgi:hypothetical protein